MVVCGKTLHVLTWKSAYASAHSLIIHAERAADRKDCQSFNGTGCRAPGLYIFQPFNAEVRQNETSANYAMKRCWKA